MRTFIKRFIKVGVPVLVLVVSLSTGWVCWQSWSRIDSTAHREWIIVLGDRVHDGKPSIYLKDRLDTAVSILKADRAHRVLISGHAGSKKGDEVAAMRKYLLGHGVDPAIITDDRHGVTTYNTCARAKRVFDITEAIVVTQDFHLRRAVALCRQQGIDVIGAESLTDAGVYLTARNWFREIVLSRPKAVADAVLNPGPRTLDR